MIYCSPIMDRKNENNIDVWKKEETAAFEGWDFSHLKGRWENEQLPWDYKTIISKYLRPEMQLLDLGTGGGEFLLELNHPAQRISVTEGYAPNFALCRQRLEPLGITVRFTEKDDCLDFPDGYFDMVINRHESFSIAEVKRVLKPGGYFITQQIGGKNDIDLACRINPDFVSDYADNDLMHIEPQFVNAGFNTIEKAEAFSPIRFFDTGAFVYFAKIIEWEFPGFSVDSHIVRLYEFENEIAEKGYLEGTEHRYMLVVKNST